MRIMTAVLLISMGLRIQENLLYFPFSLAHWVWYLRWKRLIYLPSVKSDKRMRSLSNFAGCAKLIETDPGRITAKRGILFNLCVIIKETYVYFALSSSRQCKSNGKYSRGRILAQHTVSLFPPALNSLVWHFIHVWKGICSRSELWI